MEIFSICLLTHKYLQQVSLGWVEGLKPEAWNSIQVSHVAGAAVSQGVSATSWGRNRSVQTQTTSITLMYNQQLNPLNQNAVICLSEEELIFKVNFAFSIFSFSFSLLSINFLF